MAWLCIVSEFRITEYIPLYSSYSRDRRKEDDLAVRKKLISEISKSKEHLKNIQESFHEKGDTKSSQAMRKVIDELDVFTGEIDLSEMGRKYPFFSIQTSSGIEETKKLIGFDATLIERTLTVTETCSKLETAVLDGEDYDFNQELLKIRQYITTARNEYKNRIEIIRGMR